MQWASWQKASGALAPGHRTEMHRRQNADDSTETLELRHLSVTHYLYMLHLYNIHCWPSQKDSINAFSLHALSDCLRKWGVTCTTLLGAGTPQLVSSSTPLLNATTNLLSSPWKQSVHYFSGTKCIPSLHFFPFNLSVSPQTLCLVHPVSRLTLKNSLSCQVVSLYFHLQDALKTSHPSFFFTDVIMRACWTCRGGPGLARSTGHNSCHSGWKPGLNLQREIIERVFIHDQSLIQQVLGHLDREQKAERNNSLT